MFTNQLTTVQKVCTAGERLVFHSLERSETSICTEFSLNQDESVKMFYFPEMELFCRGKSPTKSYVRCMHWYCHIPSFLFKIHKESLLPMKKKIPFLSNFWGKLHCLLHLRKKKPVPLTSYAAKWVALFVIPSFWLIMFRNSKLKCSGQRKMQYLLLHSVAALMEHRNQRNSEASKGNVIYRLSHQGTATTLPVMAQRH